jgi:hypothetical protein
MVGEMEGEGSSRVSKSVTMHNAHVQTSRGVAAVCDLGDLAEKCCRGGEGPVSGVGEFSRSVLQLMSRVGVVQSLRCQQHAGAGIFVWEHVRAGIAGDADDCIKTVAVV